MTTKPPAAKTQDDIDRMRQQWPEQYRKQMEELHVSEGDITERLARYATVQHTI
ncbi:MAG: hypothetical protein WCB27_14830 [Thermoguttaceae bacterium]|jgi:hypothetical protein